MAAKPQAKAGIYCRISDDRTGEAVNVGIQERECRKLAKQLGVPVHDVYIDNDISASRYGKKRRPNYERLLADIQAGVIQMVVTYHPSRLHRRPLELERYIEISRTHGILTHTVHAGRWDLSTASGMFQARILGDADAYESDRKSELITAKRAEQAKLGAFSGGTRPYGYDKYGIQIIEEEAEIIRAAVDAVVMFTRKAQGPGPSDISLRYLVRDLNERGVLTAKGKTWTSHTLKSLIMSPRIAGLSSYKGEIVSTEAEWPAIVEMDKWRAACAILGDESRRKGEHHRGGLVKWLGSGVYICGLCGKPQLRVSHGSGKRCIYRCWNRENGSGGGHVTREARSLDNFVEQVLVAKLSDARVLAKLAQKGTSKPVDVKALEVEQTAIARLLEEQTEMHAAGEISRAQVIAGTKRLKERQKELDDKLARAGGSTPLEPIINRKGKTMSEVWYGPGGPEGDRDGGLSLQARRAIIQRVVTITVNPAKRGKYRQPGGGFLDTSSIDFDWQRGQ